MLQIGEFSKICQVSVKTLHPYDKIGLLVPAEVDRFTGYRYYLPEQIDTMNYIGRLNITFPKCRTIEKPLKSAD